MARLIYSGITSLDGFVADREGSFDWSAPDEQVHAFVNELQRPIGTYLYGRRLYEVMLAWESLPTTGQPPFMQDYAEIWRSDEKVVYSTTLEAVSSGRTRIESRFDADAVRRLKSAASRDLVVGGPRLAAEALHAGVVDEIHQLISPVIVGGGKRFLPDGIRSDLELLDERRFENGVAYLRYRVIR